MTELTAVLPKVRRFRRPPTRLLWLAAWSLVCFGFVIRLLVEGLGDPWRAFSALALMGLGCLWYRQFIRTLNAWLAGRPVAPVPRIDWMGPILMGFILAIPFTLAIS